MKYSGIEWIGNIPDNWEINKVKHCFYISKQQVREKNPVILKLARTGIQVRDISNNEGQLAASYENYNLVEPGDLLLNPMDLYSGANCNMSEISGVISPAYINLRKKIDLNPKFFDYFFKTQYWTMAMFAHGKGVSFDNRWTLNNEVLLNYVLPTPDKRTQDIVVLFLNETLRQIDKLIDVERQQITVLGEFKDAFITKIVTKGVDKKVFSKSGIDSIGSYPSDWKLIKFKYVCESFEKGSGITKEQVYSDGDIGCIRYGDIYSKYEYSVELCCSKTNRNEIESPTFINYGDLLFAGTGELVEEIGKNIVYLGKEKCLAGSDIIVAKHKQNPAFLNYALCCAASQVQKSKGKAKLKVVHISASNIGNIVIALPPLEEQKRLAAIIDKKISEINGVIELKKQKLEQLKEYKKSLIYEYVTGKKEVGTK